MRFSLLLNLSRRIGPLERKTFSLPKEFAWMLVTLSHSERHGRPQLR
jgi:hypothetical protein